MAMCLHTEKLEGKKLNATTSLWMPLRIITLIFVINDLSTKKWKRL